MNLNNPVTSFKSILVNTLLFTVVAGCAPVGGDNGPPSLDGEWKLASLQAVFDECFTVEQGAIVRYGVCGGGPGQPIESTDPAIVSGDRVIWKFLTRYRGELFLITLDLEDMGDGTYQGRMITDLLVLLEAPPEEVGVVVERLSGP